MNDKQILSVPLLSRFCEVERLSDDDFAVDDHHLTVSDSVKGIDEYGDACPGEEIGR